VTLDFSLKETVMILNVFRRHEFRAVMFTLTRNAYAMFIHPSSYLYSSIQIILTKNHYPNLFPNVSQNITINVSAPSLATATVTEPSSHKTPE
jgi:hypothetical protein